MAQRLFGTDGVRGRAGTYPLDVRTIRRLGGALVRALPRVASEHSLLVGRDTRESGGWMARELAHGARSAGGRVTSAGVISTPAVAYLTREASFDAGVVISASHNPFEDNGIKVFSGAGEKFTERLESEIEGVIADVSWEVPAGDAHALPDEDLSAAYLAHARRALPSARALAGIRVAVDCSNGATTGLAPRLLRELGLDVVAVACEPNGRNINRDCGSTHPEFLARTVVEEGCRIGIAFDGDGDRTILVDHRGNVVNGDGVMLLAARHLQATGRLRGNAIVATVMSNIGLEVALRETGIAMIRCPVGDKHVMEEMLARGLSLGGEQSGHVIFSDFLFTGDGLVTALNVLEVMAATGRDLSDLAGQLTTFPQVLLNVRVKTKPDLAEMPRVASAVREVERRLGDSGRVLVRYSGTEPLLRVMLEGPDQRLIQEWAELIADSVRQHIG
ncbi:MAG: phosphoglucosamine mutase [Acidobacteria bacterium]|nr:MAG: phosphoglucosamine mutase [Acidobacteriota bacterium]